MAARPLRAVAGIDLRRVIDLFAAVEIVEFDEIPSVSRDPKDGQFLVTARLSKAAFLVSEDRDRLDLTSYEGVTIIDTAGFLEILAGDQSE